MPVTTIEASASYDVLYDAIIDVMEKDCRLPNKDEDGWIVNDDPPKKRFSRAYFRQDFKNLDLDMRLYPYGMETKPSYIRMADTGHYRRFSE